MNRRARRLLPVVLLAALLVLPGAVPWAQASSNGEARVVAAYTISRGVVQPDPGVSVAAANRRSYGRRHRRHGDGERRRGDLDARAGRG